VPSKPYLPQELTDLVHRQLFPILMMTVGGSHAFGYAASDTDYDLRGIHVLPIDIALGIHEDQYTVSVREQISRLEVDLLTYDIKRYLTFIMEENSFVIEFLYAPPVAMDADIIAELKAVCKKSVTRNHAYNYIGYAKKQWKLVEKFFPYSVKPFLNSFRILLTGLNLMQTAEVELHLPSLAEKYNLPYLNDLVEEMELKGKTACLDNDDLNFYQTKFEALLEQLENARYRSPLPTEPSGKNEMNDLLVRIRKSYGRP
jgi:predicted nucleotidyltransferase